MHGHETVRASTGYPWHMPTGWWLKKGHYFGYMIRELTAVFAAAWVVAFLFQLPMVKTDPSGWVRTIESPGWLVFSFIAILFVLYHAWTAFTATSTLMYVRMGKQVVPGAALNGSMFLAFVGATIVLVAIMLYILVG